MEQEFVTRHSRPIKVWCLIRDQIGHVKPVEQFASNQAEFIYDAEWNPEGMLRSQPDIVLCVNDFPYDVVRCLDAARANYIPSLVLQDGILEWRCQYENPLFGAGGGAPQHQPVIADKIACIGAQSARQISAWGNSDKVEITGMPRLDSLLTQSVPPPQHPGRRVLVMTAKKPWFDSRQKKIILQSLHDVKQTLDAIPGIEVYWRVTKNLEETLSVHNHLTALGTQELATILGAVDAVITTPSTAMLEAMLLSRPVAALDYFNVPRFVSAAWTISAKDHIVSTLHELLTPPASKMAFQQDCLADVLSHNLPAAPRVWQLMYQMIEVAEQQRQTQSRLHLPNTMLAGAKNYTRSGLLSLETIYPGQPVFADNNIQSLQVRLARLSKENDRLQSSLQSRSIGYWISLSINYIARRVGFRKAA